MYHKTFFLLIIIKSNKIKKHFLAAKSYILSLEKITKKRIKELINSVLEVD